WRAAGRDWPSFRKWRRLGARKSLRRKREIACVFIIVRPCGLHATFDMLWDRKETKGNHYETMFSPRCACDRQSASGWNRRAGATAGPSGSIDGNRIRVRSFSDQMHELSWKSDHG